MPARAPRGRVHAVAAKAPLPAAAATDETQRVRFGRNLAHNDKKVRDKTVKVLARFLAARELPDVEHERLWKGLFYCMWLADKVHVQQELADNLGALLHAPRGLGALAYMRAFWATMTREWPGIDHLRLDKFYSLMRALVRHAFLWIKAQQWSLTAAQLYGTMLSLGPLSTDERASCASIANHVADVFWEELLKAAPEAQLGAEVTAALLQPFVQLLGQTRLHNVFARVVESVLEPLLTTGEIVDVRYEDEEATPKGNLMRVLDLADVPAMVLRLASDRNMLDRFRPQLYDLHRRLQAKASEQASARAAEATTSSSGTKRKQPETPAAGKRGKRAKDTAAQPSESMQTSEPPKPAAEPVQATPSKPTHTKAAASPSRTPSKTPERATADSAASSPASEVFTTAPSTPVPAATPQRPILRKTPQRSSARKAVRISLDSNTIKPFLRGTPPAAISSADPNAAVTAPPPRSPSRSPSRSAGARTPLHFVASPMGRRSRIALPAPRRKSSDFFTK